MRIKKLPKHLRRAHRHSSHHRAEVMASSICGCFYCCKTFRPKRIKKITWIDNGNTALCPYCGIDAVIGSASGETIIQAFLEDMRQHWFGN